MCPFFLGKTVCVCICAPCRLCRGALFCCQKGARFRILSRKGVSCESKKQLSNVYLYTFFSTFTITDAVWVALLAARGFTLAQIGLAEGIFHAVSLLCEVLSDRRATLISVDSMAYSLLMIPASPLVGAVGDAFGQAGAGLALLGGLVAVSGLVLLGQKT